MLDPQTIKIGNKYRNIKTGDVYEVVLISKNSEDVSEILVSYSKSGDELPYTRPQSLFITKFMELTDVSA